MSVNFWNLLLQNLKGIVENIEHELSKDINKLLSLLGQIISSEESILMNDALPLIRQIAINIQNSQPGLSASEFISELMKASLPVLEEEGIKLVNTALSIVVAAVAHELRTPDIKGNAGTIS